MTRRPKRQNSIKGVLAGIRRIDLSDKIETENEKEDISWQISQ